MCLSYITANIYIYWQNQIYFHYFFYNSLKFLSPLKKHTSKTLQQKENSIYFIYYLQCLSVENGLIEN